MNKQDYKKFVEDRTFLAAHFKARVEVLKKAFKETYPKQYNLFASHYTEIFFEEGGIRLNSEYTMPLDVLFDEDYVAIFLKAYDLQVIEDAKEKALKEKMAKEHARNRREIVAKNRRAAEFTKYLQLKTEFMNENNSLENMTKRDYLQWRMAWKSDYKRLSFNQRKLKIKVKIQQRLHNHINAENILQQIERNRVEAVCMLTERKHMKVIAGKSADNEYQKQLQLS